ncbi:methyltransferase domain-containing protein [Mycolicibacterium sp. jd]|uniref:methyltransferase domain-containing protein n=1 Tax=unclassified Mycolicibacterium TaxID=2636767 RepID=UPI00351BD4BE
MQCRLCDSDRMLSVLDLGASPPSQSFLPAESLDAPEPTYPLHLRLCESCLLLQIPALITSEDTFTEYAYFSSYSDSWVEHAKSYVDETARRLRLGQQSFVVEVASNDGYLLKHVQAKGIPCLGIEPSVNVGAAARALGVPTRTAFLDEEEAASVRAEHGPADLVIANNVYAHIPNLREFTRALRGLMCDDGWLSIEVHYALNLVAFGQFDTIYHEHFQYYTVFSAMLALAEGGLSLVDVEMLSTHGGSIRLWARPEGAARRPSERVTEALCVEKAAGLHDVDGYVQLRGRTEAIRHEFLTFLLECKRNRKRVVAYGAPAKGNTLLNYCGIHSDLIEYTVDRNPYKHGCFTPGTRIPIHDPARIDIDKPDVVVVLPWNLESELTAQLSHVAEWGGQLVYPLPTLHSADLHAAQPSREAETLR